MRRADMLEFDGISRSVLEARITTLVRLLDAIEARCDLDLAHPSHEEVRGLIDRAVRDQIDREHG